MSSLFSGYGPQGQRERQREVSSGKYFDATLNRQIGKGLVLKTFGASIGIVDF